MDFLNIIGTLFDNSVEHVVALANQIKDLRLGKNQQDINEDIYNLIQTAKETKEKAKGYFDSYSSLVQNVDSPEIGDWAIVKNPTDGKWYIYKCIVRGYWKGTQEEYSTDINLNEYTKKGDFKTVNGQSLLGEGDIEILGEHYEVVSQNNDGLLSKEFYLQLLEMRNETLPTLQEHLDNLLLLFDEDKTPENIQTIIDRYNLIYEFIASLGESDNGQILLLLMADVDALQDTVEAIELDITDNIKADLTEVKNDISDIQEAVRLLNADLEEANNDVAQNFLSIYERINEVLREAGGDLSKLEGRVDDIEEDVSSLNDRITELEQNPVIPENLTRHIFLTLEEYDALSTYEKDTLYIIIERQSSGGSNFGDTFPLIFA